jgi:hypothetical protein
MYVLGVLLAYMIIERNFINRPSLIIIDDIGISLKFKYKKGKIIEWGRITGIYIGGNNSGIRVKGIYGFFEFSREIGDEICNQYVKMTGRDYPVWSGRGKSIFEHLKRTR